MESDILQPLSDENIPKLLEVLSKDLPHSIVICSWIRMQKLWQTKLPQLSVFIYCPRGDWRNGTVVAVSSGVAENDLICGVVYTLQESGDELREALVNTRRINWEKFSLFHAVLTRHESIIRSALQEQNCPALDLTPCQLHYFTSQEAAQLQLLSCPDGVRVGSLEPQHLDTVCELWPHYSPPARPMIEQMILLNPTIGVFVREGDKEELAAMVLQADYGGVGLLQTVPKYRRRGLASIAITHLIKQLGLAGISPHFHVINDNINALEMFKKLGFKIVDETNWLVAEHNDASNNLK